MAVGDNMKYVVLILVIGAALFGCTENQRAKHLGGTMNINLPAGQRLVIATFKDANLWYLVEPMPMEYTPQTKTLIEDSSFGIMSGKVIFHESR